MEDGLGWKRVLVALRCHIPPLHWLGSEPAELSHLSNQESPHLLPKRGASEQMERIKKLPHPVWPGDGGRIGGGGGKLLF